MSEVSLLNGPVWLPPHVREALSGPMCDVRHPRFTKAIVDCRIGVTAMLDASTYGVVLASGSGTFGVELVLRNVLFPGERVLALLTGSYGERMARIAELTQASVTRVTAPLGGVIGAAELDAALSADRYAYVLMVHVEPSTGTQLDLPALAAVCRHHGAVPLVDAVCSAFALLVDCERNGLGAVMTASQKGLSLPPGMAVCVVRPDLVERARAQPEERTGFHGRLENWLNPSYVFTPPMAHVFAAAASFERISYEGLLPRAARHLAAMRRVHGWAASRALTRICTDDAAAAHTLTALYYPEGRNYDWLCDLRDRLGLELAPVTDQRLIGKGFRIGHLGDLPPEHLERGLAVLDAALREAP